MKAFLRLFFAILLICGFGISSSYGTGKGYSIPKHSDTLIKWDTIPSSGAGDIMVLRLINNDSLVSGRIDTIYWSFINNGVANTPWVYNFCDFANCFYPPSLPTGQTDYLVSGKGSGGAFTLTIAHYNKVQSAIMSIRVWDKKDINNPDTIYFVVNVLKAGIEKTGLPPSSVSLYPNPSTDYINLKVNEQGFEPITAVFYNTLGKRVSEQSISPGTTSLSVFDLPKGIYIISLRDKSGKEAIKQLIKE